MKSEEHIVSDLFGYTGPTAKRRMRPCCSLLFEQSFYRRLLNSGDPLQWRCHDKDLSGGTLESSREQEQTERERRFQLK